MNQECKDLILKILSMYNSKQEEWYYDFTNILPEYEVNTGLRICHFFSQIMHETLNLMQLEENLKYKEQALLTMFAKHFNQSNVKEYACDEKKIASKIYANRMGNDSEETLDGYRYKGRGVLHTTGKANYLQVNDHLNKLFSGKFNIIENPNFLSENRELAIISGCYFWKKNNLNKDSDENNINKIRKKINGGFIGLDSCVDKFETYKILLLN